MVWPLPVSCTIENDSLLEKLMLDSHAYSKCLSSSHIIIPTHDGYKLSNVQDADERLERVTVIVHNKIYDVASIGAAAGTARFTGSELLKSKIVGKPNMTNTYVTNER